MNSKQVINVFQLLHENQAQVMEYYKAGYYTTPPMRAITGVRFPDKTICKFGEWALQYNDESFTVITDEDFQKLFASLPAAPEQGQREELVDKIASALTSVYVCTRVWEAWQYGTMAQDDFEPAWECEDLINELAELQTQAHALPVHDAAKEAADYTKWVRENWTPFPDGLWHRKVDVRDQRTDENLYIEYIAKLNKLFIMNWITGSHRLPPEFKLTVIARYRHTRTILYDFRDFVARQPHNLNLIEWLDETVSDPAALPVQPKLFYCMKENRCAHQCFHCEHQITDNNPTNKSGTGYINGYTDSDMWICWQTSKNEYKEGGETFQAFIDLLDKSKQTENDRSIM